jgi:eukaryotic-like serine/threonine-protein kinase
MMPAQQLISLESGEFEVDALGLQADDSWEIRLPPERVLQGSGEVLVGPFRREEGSGWETATPSTSNQINDTREHQVSEHGSDSILHRNPVMPASHRRLSRFEITGIVGEGHHATVYRAFDPLLERHVALKLPRQSMAITSRARARFLGEARALARLCHPRIVPIYEAGLDGNRYYIAMALIDGHSLAELLAAGQIPLRQAVEITTELAEALAYAHGLGIIHRDVKPANIRLDQQGAVYLMDFGIAYRPESGEVPTPPGTILGTPAYLAPEQAKGGQTSVLPASDQYSLGAVLYELLCGKPPFFGPPSCVLFHAIHEDPPSPRTIEPKVPRPLAAICRKAMAKRPDRRYASCQALADDLRRWLRGEAPQIHRRRWPRLVP